MAHPKNDVDALLKARADIDDQLRQHKSTLTVLFTDIVGSTSYFERNGDTAGLAMIHRHDKLATSVVQRHGGRIIKTIGDSAMAEFNDPVSAVRAGVEIERQFLTLNLTLAESQRVEVRIGIHSGMGYRKGNDLFGDVINVAARIVKRTSPAQILISRAVYEAICKEDGLHCQWLSKIGIDGRSEKEDIFEVAWTDAETYREVRERLTGRSSIPSRFEVLSQVGAGAVGVVYKVRDLETDEIVALKILKPEIACDTAVQENFKKELCLSRKITHKNVCRIHDFGRANGVTYASMEFIEGESLLSRMDRVGVLPVSHAVDIVRQICSGLHEAHALGIVHCDIKPANIMLDREGVVKIMDFGGSRLIQDNGPAGSAVVGTPSYMAPEQAELKPVSARTDIYSLGLVLYEMVTGVRAFTGDTPVAVALKQIREHPKAPREIVPKLSPLIEAAILKCIQKESEKRFQSVDELANALQKAVKARRVAAWRVSLDRELRKAEMGTRRMAREGVQAAAQYLRRQDWRAHAQVRRKLAAALVLPALLGGAITYARYSAGRGSAASAPYVTHVSAAPNEVSMDELRTVRESNSAGPMMAHEVDLNSGSFAQELASQSPAVERAHQDPKAAVDIALFVPAPAAKAVKREKAPARAIGAKTMATSQGPAKSQAQPDSVQIAAVTLQDATEPAVSNDTARSAQQEIAAAEAVTEQTAAMEIKTAESNAKPVAAGPKTSNLYVEVGSFKDETWATAAVEKLTQLGYHAILIHKNMLWSQSYHVEVGPYPDSTDIVAARQSLASQGFKLGAVTSTTP